MEEFVSYFTDKILSDRQNIWSNNIGTTVGTAFPPASSFAANTLTINQGYNGANAILKRSFVTSIFTNSNTGDKIWLRLLLTESKVGLVNDILTISLKRAGVDVTPLPNEITLRSYSENPLWLEMILPYTLQSASDNLEITLTVKSTAPVQSSSQTISWQTLNLFNRTDGYTNAIDIVDSATRKSEYVYTFFERAATISKAPINSGADSSARIQSEINNAIATSGEIIFPQKGAILVKTPLSISGGLFMKGRGTIFKVDIPGSGQELFTVSTPERIICEDFTIYRENGSVMPTSFKFTVSNKDSIFRRITFENIPETLYLDYVDGLVLDSCTFVAGQNSIKIGYTNPSSVKNVTIQNCKFIGVNIACIWAKSSSNLNIYNNRFAVGSVAPERNIVVIPESGDNQNLRIIGNVSDAFIKYSIRVGTDLTATLKNVLISDNCLVDNSGTTDCLPIAVTGKNPAPSSPPFSIDGIVIKDNQIRNRAIGIYVKDISNLNLNGNSVIGQVGLATTRGLYAENCVTPRIIDLNLLSGQILTNIITP
ncbi:Right handed beta helix region [Dyadobacter sp. SG02]|uniref:right-handed parallel beta-helix repeat-containing protein n=1 Tax=Dyadobacter sp. SG02 TaxID=1855291 RepID=UPI0008D5B4B2|nr:hypothetical protein [Dyadobacter sp. SG02]SEJ32704.1 Right handed beta helix region [Dyadobacter sp. SG02]